MEEKHPIRRLREEAGLSMYQLAVLAGVTPSVIYSVEKGRTKGYRVDTLWKLVAALAKATGKEVAEIVEEVMEWEASASRNSGEVAGKGGRAPMVP